MTELITVDHSTLATFATCKEKARLAYMEHLRPIKEAPPLVFGSAFHAALACYYESFGEHTTFPKEKRKNLARAAFLEVVKKNPSALPMLAEDAVEMKERRSVERGLYLVDAYIDKWADKDITWADVLDPSTGKPYVEVGFAVYFMDWHGVPVVMVGKIDRMRRNRVDGKAYVWESKTTGSGVKRYVQQVRPNHQLTTYKWAASELLQTDAAGIILDVVHVSDRKIDGKYPNGIDIENDFARVETRRSSVDIEEFLYDLTEVTREYLEHVDSGKKRWHRNAPSACFMYGGCHFADICTSNLNENVIRSKYKVERWEPWEISKASAEASSLTLPTLQSS